MDCDLCLDEFDPIRNIPKVLNQCGHTFCENCLMKLWTSGEIACPMCRKKTKIINSNDLPQTNYQLLKLYTQMNEEKKSKSLLERYRLINMTTYLEVEEVIYRETAPLQLSLYGIFEDELIYKENTNGGNMG